MSYQTITVTFYIIFHTIIGHDQEVDGSDKALLTNCSASERAESLRDCILLVVVVYAVDLV